MIEDGGNIIDGNFIFVDSATTTGNLKYIFVELTPCCGNHTANPNIYRNNTYMYMDGSAGTTTERMFFLNGDLKHIITVQDKKITY